MTFLPEKEGLRHQRVEGLFERGVKRSQSIPNRQSPPNPHPPPNPPPPPTPRHSSGIWLEFSSVYNVACENNRFSSLPAAAWRHFTWTNFCGSATKNSITITSVWNRVRSADWSMEKLHCFSYCLRFTDNEKFTDNEECQEMPMSSRETQMLLLKKNIFYKYCLFC